MPSIIGPGEILFLLVLLGFALFGIGGTILWLWMLIDCLKNEAGEGNTKIVWTIVIVLTHWVGALIYLLARRQERIRELGK